MLFHYADEPHYRRHGPQGYRDYRFYKPWLRDEFQFRCIYCLCHERWFPDGDNSFSIDHLQPQSVAPSIALDYNNLVYACCQCNAAKGDAADILDPCRHAFGRHLSVSNDGVIHGLTPQGTLLIQVCRLDREKLTAFRRGIIELYQTLTTHQDAGAGILLERFFGFPSNLPDLSALRPPAGNTRPNGIEDSYFKKRFLGKLSALMV